MIKRNGKVFLIGAGPGDEKLITLKGVEYLKKADVVICDRLVNPSLLKYVSSKTNIMYVGRENSSGGKKQDYINKLLLREAGKGKKVIRLKGGDPFLFGRGGEEAEFLSDNDVPFEVIPGVSSALAVPASAGIPVTHRDFSSSLFIITGTGAKGKKNNIRDQIKAFKKAKGTLVVLMGAGRTENIINTMTREGIPLKTPAAMIERGTTTLQRVASGTIGNIAKLVKKMNISPPAIFIIGEVVKLMHKMKMSDKPLSGRKVLVTSSRNKTLKICNLIKEAGGIPFAIPMITTEERKMSFLKKQMVNELPYAGWLVFSSTKGVEIFKKIVGEKIRYLQTSVKICAIGEVTAEALKEYGIKVDFVPEEYSSKGLVCGFSKKGIKGERIIIFRSSIGNKLLSEELRKLGAVVKEYQLYDINPAIENKMKLNRLIDKGVDIITFTSASAVRGFVALAGIKKAKTVCKDSAVVAIGTVTADELKGHGIMVNVVPERFTVPHMVSAIKSYFYMEA